MGTKFTPNVGYRGIAKLDNVILLATGGSFNQSHTNIPSSGVWGAGYQNAAEIVAYSNNYIQIDGSVSIELTAGDVFDRVKKFAFTNRGSEKGTLVEIYPNGFDGFMGYSWCTSMSFQASSDANITSDIGFKSYLDGENNKVITGYSVSDAENKMGQSGGSLDFAYNSLFPYWFSYVSELKDGGKSEMEDIIDWSCSYSSDLVMMKLCGKGEDGAEAYVNSEDSITPLAPDYVALGSMSADCNLTIFALKDRFKPEAFHRQMGFEFTMRSPSAPNDRKTITIPKAVSTSTSGSITSGASWIQAAFPFTAIGDGANPPLDLD